MYLLQPDHLAICAETLAEGVAMVEDLLGVALAPGGDHVFMGTHNRLLSLGPGLYLEVIAINPDAALPGRVRWFDMDRFSGPPRLTNWICRTHDLPRALTVAPDGIGRVIPAARVDLRWQMVVPDDGCLPFDGAYPALIAWEGSAHPSDRLPDQGCRLKRLDIGHPDAAALRKHLQPQLDMATIDVRKHSQKRLVATIETPSGPRLLQ